MFTRDDFRQLELLLRPLRQRVSNMIARAVIHLVDDGTKLQLLQIGALAGETIGNAEHHQPYGFTSVPLAGAEAIALFPSGDRARPLVIVSDRRHRPTGGEPGQVTMYHHTGTVVTMLENGTVEIRSAAGVALPLATKQDLENLKAAISGAVIVAQDGGSSLQSTLLAALSAWPVGTTVLKAE